MTVAPDAPEPAQPADSVEPAESAEPLEPAEGPAEDWLAANRRHWDDISAQHAAGGFYDLASFRAGRDDLRPFEDAELGPVAGLDLVHLQCHLGTDTLSLARRGARVVGLDLSAASIAAARDLAGSIGLAADFVRADVYDAVAALGGRTFDVVYTGVGALCWLPDLDRWAAVVAALLRPGGVLYLVEIHPLVNAVYDDGRTLTGDILHSTFDRDEYAGPSYAGATVSAAGTVTFARNWTVAEVVTAVLGAGLRLELLADQDVTDNPLPWMERGPDRLYRFAEEWPRFPVTFSLRARRA